MRRILIGLALLLMVSTAFAQSTTNTTNAPQGPQIFQAYGSDSTFAPPMSDYSVAYLSQIFGTVGNVLTGSGSQIVGKMFKVFNEGILIVASLWLSYTTITMALNAAISGSPGGGPNKNVAILLLRIALGFALIIPSSATGYSLLQDIYMKIVVQGVGLADKVWNKALDYLQNGGDLYIPPSTLNQDTNMVKNAITGTTTSSLSISSSNYVSNYGSLGYAAQVFTSAVCMYESAYLSGGMYTTAPTYTAPSTAYTSNGGLYLGGSGGVSFPYGCGSFTAYYTYSSGCSTINQCNQLNQYAYDALKQLVLSILPAAQAYVNAANPYTGTAYNNASSVLTISNIVPPSPGANSFTCPTTGSSPACSNSDTMCSSACSLLNSNAKDIFTALVSYGSLITPYQSFVSKNNSTSDNFMQYAKEQGWIMAGSFYWKVEQTNSNSSSMNVSNLGPSSSGFNPTNSNAATVISQAMNDVLNSYNGNPSIIGTLWTNYVGAQQNADYSGAPSSGSSAGGFAGQMENGAMGAAGSFALSNSNAYNPIATLMNFGRKLLIASTTIWVVAIAISVGVAVGAGICNSTSPGGLILQAGMTWLKSILMLITTLLLMPGCILAYYVPLYPFTVFTFASIGWLLMVVEGMAAAPLVCMGLTHPEGHDFLGKAEQALMLFLGIFVRPALMIIGLVTAMVISFVAFTMLCSGFGEVLDSLKGDSSSAFSFAGGGPFVYLLSSVMVLIIFGAMAMEVVEQCFKLVYQLPNAILKWIGGPQTGEEYGQMASQLKGAVSAGAGATKEGMQGADKAGAEFTASSQKAQDKKFGSDNSSSIDAPG